MSDFTFPFHFHALEKETATHSSVLAWRIPGTVEPGGLPSMGSQSQTRLKRLSSSSRQAKLCADLQRRLSQPFLSMIQTTKNHFSFFKSLRPTPALQLTTQGHPTDYTTQGHPTDYSSVHRATPLTPSHCLLHCLSCRFEKPAPLQELTFKRLKTDTAGEVI